MLQGIDLRLSSGFRSQLWLPNKYKTRKHAYVQIHKLQIQIAKKQIETLKVRHFVVFHQEGVNIG